MEEHSRRTFLTATGVAIASGITGCVGSPTTVQSAGDGSGGGETTATATTETSDTVEDADHEHHDGHHHEDIPDEPVDSVTVEMITTDDGYHFSPHVTWVAEGGTVTFVNESGSHSATAYHPDNDRPRRIPEGGTAFDSGILTEQGDEFEVTFETPGVYDYFCRPHETIGMVASIIVGEPDAHDQPGLSDPGDGLPEGTHEKIRDLNGMVEQALGHTHEEESGESDHHEEDGHDESEGDGHDDHDH